MHARSHPDRATLTPPSLPRITYIVDTAGYGGAEIYLEHLLRGGMSRARPTVLVAEPGVPLLAAVASSVGAPVGTFRSVTTKFRVLRLMRLARAIKQTHADVVHVNMTTATNNRYAIAAAWLVRVPVIATVHTPIALGERPTALLRWLFARAWGVVAVSAEVRKLLVETLHLPIRRIHLVKNGVDVGPAIPIRPAPKIIRVVAIGRLDFAKGFDLLVAAVRLLVGQGVPVELVIAGDGPERVALEQAADRLPVHFPGFVADIESVWASADIFCLPSRFEGLPLALLEAMMHGIPCVATDVGDVAVALGSAGIVVHPRSPAALADALALLAGDPERRRELGAAGRARAQANYTAESMVAATLDLSLAAATRPSSRGAHNRILI